MPLPKLLHPCSFWLVVARIYTSTTTVSNLLSTSNEVTSDFLRHKKRETAFANEPDIQVEVKLSGKDLQLLYFKEIFKHLLRKLASSKYGFKCSS